MDRVGRGIAAGRGLALASLLALAGCTAAGVAVGAGASVGVAASQERGVQAAADDTGIKLGVNDRLLKHDVELYGKVATAVVEGRVLLTGAVRDQAARDQAGRLAWQVKGVGEVINELQVANAGGIEGFGRDSRITAELRLGILGDRQVADINYAIDTVNGVVYLIGIAQSQAEIDRVIEHARGISGVRRVVSHVWTKDDPRRRAAAR